MLGASSLDPSSSSSASPWHSNSASAVGHPSTNSCLPSKSTDSPEAEADLPTSFSHVNVKEEFSQIIAFSDEVRTARPFVHVTDTEPVASTSGGSGVFEENAPFEADASRRHSMTSSSIPEPRPPGAPPQLHSTAQTSGLMCQPPGYHAVQHSQEVGPAVPPHPMQRPPPVNNNSPLLVNLLSSQQQTSMVGGPSGANAPPHHQSYSPAGSYIYPSNAQPHQHPHPSNVPQSAGPPVMDPQQHMAMQQQNSYTSPKRFYSNSISSKLNDSKTSCALDVLINTLVTMRNHGFFLAD
uniref:PAX-interacting protein 1 n=1 Tax=Angiostrongylus cantonensis TaxID=6313 RepID=A0A0K0CUE6_ANGCA